MRSRIGTSAGFSLIEIMVVVMILGLLAAIAAPKYLGFGDKAKQEAARAEVRALSDAVQLFKVDNGRLPTSGEGLAALVPPPPGDLPRYNPDGYMEGVPQRDPWGNPYVYSTDGRRFAVVSFGADGSPGGDGFDADIDSSVLTLLRSRGT
jgi:general secretion pathway protein G